VRYGVKELAKLNKLVDLDKAGQEDFVMKDVVTVTDVSKYSDVPNSDQPAGESNDAGMDVDSKYHHKTLRDENGHYPTWMNQRSVHRLKKKGKTCQESKG